MSQNKFQVLFVDCSGNYEFHNFNDIRFAVQNFRSKIDSSKCLLCDLRVCGSLESLASYRNYKLLKICGL